MTEDEQQLENFQDRLVANTDYVL